jgi:hypothetical protein
MNDKSSFQDAYCTVCRVHLRAHKTDLLKHSNIEGHKKNMKRLNPVAQGQATLLGHVKRISNKMKERDLKIAVHIAMHSSIRSVDHLGELLNQISDEKHGTIKFHRTKCTLLIKKVISRAY